MRYLNNFNGPVDIDDLKKYEEYLVDLMDDNFEFHYDHVGMFRPVDMIEIKIYQPLDEYRLESGEKDYEDYTFNFSSVKDRIIPYIKMLEDSYIFNNNQIKLEIARPYTIKMIDIDSIEDVDCDNVSSISFKVTNKITPIRKFRYTEDN